MILSLHPAIDADENRIIAGRPPTPEEIELMGKARAIILPQGVTRQVYRLANQHCLHVFPNYRARFEYTGKVGMARICRKFGMPHPPTEVYDCVDEFTGNSNLTGFPVVVKSNHSGEGRGVHLVENSYELDKVLAGLEAMEQQGWRGFVIQEHIDNPGRDLRVVTIGDEFQCYWRVGPSPRAFKHNLSEGSRIDYDSDPHLQRSGVELVRQLTVELGINLAGFDVLFARNSHQPLMLEINYFFGRRGLGGSENFYQLLERAVARWIDTLP